MVDFVANLTRPHWGGPNADKDIHLEEHLGIVDSAFAYTSRFAPLMNIRTLRGTNVARVDRFGKVTVGGRKSGQELTRSRVVNDKFNLVVDTLLYLRHQFDTQDEWTSDLQARAEVARLDGIELAKMFDQACIIAVMKAADAVVPTGLEGNFYGGLIVPADISTSGLTGEQKAEILVRAHRKGCEELVKRDLGDMLYSEGITAMKPEAFSILLEHNRLMNVEYQALGGANDFVRARVAILNGVKVLETPRFPAGAITTHPLGDAFNVTATEATRAIVTFIPSLTLITAQVQPVTARFWEDEDQFSWVLDTFQMYNIGARRPDAAFSVQITGDLTTDTNP